MRLNGTSLAAALALALALALATGAARAQPALSQPDLDAAVTRGRLATLATLCGLRRQDWGEDLRRAAMQDATRAPSPDDPALRAAPDSDTAAAALGYAEAEALEDFAASPAVATCATVARDPRLIDADDRVSAYRADLARSLRQY